MSPSDSLDHPGPILYHSEPPEPPEVPYSTNQELFFAVSYSKLALVRIFKVSSKVRTSEFSRIGYEVKFILVKKSRVRNMSCKPS